MQVNRQAGNAEDRGFQKTMRGQVHWVQHSFGSKLCCTRAIYKLSPRLELYQRYSGQTPARGMDHLAKAGIAETGAANENTRSGPKHERCRAHIHSHLEQGASRPLPLSSATGRGASLQRPWLQLRAVRVIAALK